MSIATGRRRHEGGGKVERYWEGETRLEEGHGWLVQDKGGLLFLLMSWSFMLLLRLKTRGQLPVHFLEIRRLGLKFKELLESYGHGEIPMEQIAEKLMKGTKKASDESKLPHIISLDWEYNLSSIFVEADRPQGCCGTRSTAAISTRESGEASFHEIYLENNIN